MSTFNGLSLLAAAEAFFFAYFIAINLGYLTLNALSFFAMKRHLDSRSLEDLPAAYTGLEPPVSLLVPAFNEELTIAASVRSMLQLDYAEHEVIVVNDGSKDATLAVLIEQFAMQRFPLAYRVQLATQEVRGIYRSSTYENLLLVDKENGGKADALNAGINVAQYPLFCAVDADSVLQRDSLRKVVEPFMEDPAVIATGGTVRVANGSQVESGFLRSIGLPRSRLALFQVVEYLRAFLFGRLGWSPLNAVLVISGAFGVFKRDRVIAAGGYLRGCMGEDMELVLRLHRMERKAGRPYAIRFVPDPICWTEVPESLSVLKSQRIRWHRGLAESLWANLGLMFNRRGGTPGWIGMPFMILVEWFSPLVELAGYGFMFAGFAAGLITADVFLLFLAVALVLGIALSISALLLEELSFHTYSRPRDLAQLILAAVLENFGYRQLNSLFRLIGIWRWLSNSKRGWGAMKRTATWHSSP